MCMKLDARRALTIAGAVLGSAGFLLAAPSVSHGANDTSPIVRLYVVQQPLTSVFETLGNLAGVGVQVDPAVDKNAANVNLQGRHQSVFSQLSRQYNLYYWFDGSRYSIHLPANLSRWTISVDKINDDYVSKVIAYTAPFISSDSIVYNKELRVINILGPRELRDAIDKNLANFTRESPDSIAIIRFGVANR
jgi:type II secretory pathway component GspD/PulD (secretin)